MYKYSANVAIKTKLARRKNMKTLFTNVRCPNNENILVDAANKPDIA